MVETDDDDDVDDFDESDSEDSLTSSSESDSEGSDAEKDIAIQSPSKATMDMFKKRSGKFIPSAKVCAVVSHAHLTSGRAPADSILTPADS